MPSWPQRRSTFLERGLCASLTRRCTVALMFPAQLASSGRSSRFRKTSQRRFVCWGLPEPHRSALHVTKCGRRAEWRTLHRFPLLRTSMSFITSLTKPHASLQICTISILGYRSCPFSIFFMKSYMPPHGFGSCRRTLHASQVNCKIIKSSKRKICIKSTMQRTVHGIPCLLGVAKQKYYLYFLQRADEHHAERTVAYMYIWWGKL